MLLRFSVNVRNSEFGSAPKEFFQHADFSRAWVDGLTPWQGQTMNYLHVPCHQSDNGNCARCDYWGWPETVHRLRPKWWPRLMYCGPKHERPPHTIMNRGKRYWVTEVKLEKSATARNGWDWVLTVNRPGEG